MPRKKSELGGWKNQIAAIIGGRFSFSSWLQYYMVEGTMAYILSSLDRYSAAFKFNDRVRAIWGVKDFNRQPMSVTVAVPHEYRDPVTKHLVKVQPGEQVQRHLIDVMRYPHLYELSPAQMDFSLMIHQAARAGWDNLLTALESIPEHRRTQRQQEMIDDIRTLLRIDDEAMEKLSRGDPGAWKTAGLYFPVDVVGALDASLDSSGNAGLRPRPSERLAQALALVRARDIVKELPFHVHPLSWTENSFPHLFGLSHAAGGRLQVDNPLNALEKFLSHVADAIEEQLTLSRLWDYGIPTVIRIPDMDQETGEPILTPGGKIRFTEHKAVNVVPGIEWPVCFEKEATFTEQQMRTYVEGVRSWVADSPQADLLFELNPWLRDPEALFDSLKAAGVLPENARFATPQTGGELPEHGLYFTRLLFPEEVCQAIEHLARRQIAEQEPKSLFLTSIRRFFLPLTAVGKVVGAAIVLTLNGLAVCAYDLRTTAARASVPVLGEKGLTRDQLVARPYISGTWLKSLAGTLMDPGTYYRVRREFDPVIEKYGIYLNLAKTDVWGGKPTFLRNVPPLEAAMIRANATFKVGVEMAQLLMLRAFDQVRPDASSMERMAYANQTGLLSGTLSTLLLLPLALPLMLAGGVGAALDSLRKW